MIVEFIIAFVHPNLITRGKKFTFNYRFTTVDAIYTLQYEYNDIFLIILTLRIFMIARYFLTLSYYKTSRAGRICRMYGEFDSYQFALRCIFNRNPFRFVFIIAIFGVIFYAINMRVFEQVFDSTSRSSFIPEDLDPNSIIYSGLSDMTNALWFTFITMMTGK
jgi:hypothetical protein